MHTWTSTLPEDGLVLSAAALKTCKQEILMVQQSAEHMQVSLVWQEVMIIMLWPDPEFRLQWATKSDNLPLI